MDGILAPGDEVAVEDSSKPCTIVAPLGFGGQGEVYKAELDGRAVAVKWYYPESATVAQRGILRDLIRGGAPDARFLWPQALVSAAGKPGFGYVMALRDDCYGNIADLLTRRVSSSFRALATAGVHLADGYFRLHSRGLCYRDISSGNVFFDSSTGDVLICDNDNVGPVDAPSGIGGTMRFMAPEIVREEARPSTNTDRFSLSVLLFTMLMNHHPLEGRREASIHCFDAPAMRKLFGDAPLFIWDPENPDNRPEPDSQQNALIFWKLYPNFLKTLFVRAFTVGLHKPAERITEGQWRKALSRLRDSIFYCAKCGKQNIYDVAKTQEANGNPGPCWSCKQQLRLPPRIQIDKTTVILNHDAQLFSHHIDDSARYDFTVPIAAVTRHPSDPSRWGLKNVSGDHWTTVGPSGEMRQVNPGQSVTLRPGTHIKFGHSDGEIRV
jgi:serine/threonine protein kinase